MLLEVAFVLLGDQSIERETILSFFGAKKRGRTRIAHDQVDRRIGRAELVGIGGRVGKDHDRSFEPLGAMNRHDPNRIASTVRVALDLDLPAPEPGQEAVEACGFLPLECLSRGDQFVDRIARRAAEPFHQAAATVERTRQDPFQKLCRSFKVRRPQQHQKPVAGNAKQWLLVGPSAKLLPQRLSGVAVGERIKVVLAPSQQRRNQQRGKVEIVERLNRKANRCNQILDDQWLVEMQPIDPGNRNPGREQPRNDQRRKLGPAPDQDQYIPRGDRQAGRGERLAAVEDRLHPVRDMACVAAHPVVRPALFVGIAAFVVGNLKLERRPELDLACAFGMKGTMRLGGFRESDLFVPEVLDHLVDEVEHRLRRAKAGADRQFGKRSAAPFGKFSKMLPRFLELGRIGALEPEDRLLEVADHEQGSMLGSGTFTGKIFLGDRPDDRPLRAIGVLRFVDQQMVGCPIELEPYPIAHAFGLKQRTGPANQVVEVRNPGGTLGLRVSLGKSHPGAQARSLDRNQRRAPTKRDQFLDSLGEFVAMVLRLGHQLDDALVDLSGCPAFGEDDPLGEGFEAETAFFRTERQPFLCCRNLVFAAGLSPEFIGVRKPPQELTIEAVVMAAGGDHVFDVAFGKVHRRAESRLQHLGIANSCKGFGRMGAAHQIRDRIPLREASANDRQVIQKRPVPDIRLRGEGGQGLARKRLLLASLDRAKPRRNPRFRRKSGEQALAKAVNGLDSKRPRRIEHLCKQLPGPRHRLRISLDPERFELLAKPPGACLNPGREPAADPIGHFGRSRLGESQAQDRFGGRAANQEAKHTRG